MKHWISTRIGAVLNYCTWCEDPIYWESGKARNAQDGVRHGCTLEDALAAERRRAIGVAGPVRELPTIEEMTAEWHEPADEEMPGLEATSEPLQVGDPFSD